MGTQVLLGQKGSTKGLKEEADKPESENVKMDGEKLVKSKEWSLSVT